jgi:hypothetical protein
MTHWKHIHTEIREGFEIRFHITPEDLNPKGHFDDSDLDDVLDGIESGRYEWFLARVTAHRVGIELAVDYLGGCLYSSPLEFIKNDDYWQDMCETVIKEAKLKIQKLTEVTE